MPIALFLDTAVSFLKRYIRHLPFAAALCLAGFYYVQLNGFLWIDGARDKLESCRKDKADMLAASEANRKAQVDQVKATEAKSKAIAKEVNDEDAAKRTVYSAHAERHISGHRVRKDQVYRSTPASPSEDHNTGSVESPGAETELVAVSAEDIRICTDNTLIAEAWQSLADKLVKAGLAED